MDNKIGAEHDGWMGKKKEWKAKAWEVLQHRYREGTLLEYIYPQPEKVEDLVADDPPAMRSTSAASSSLQEIVNEPSVKTSDKECSFPATEMVEEAPVLEIDDDDLGKNAEELSEEQMEKAMERWVEQVECVAMLEKINWLEYIPDTTSNRSALQTIFENGMTYCTKFTDGCLQPWNMTDWPMNPRLWLGELERTLKVMARKRWTPRWLHRPHDQHIRGDADRSADGAVDPGNYILDMVVHALRLWQYAEAKRIDQVMKQPIAEYGHRSNKSSHGPVNLRGNIVEAMQRNLQETGSKVPSWKEDYDAVKYWASKKEPKQTQSYSSRDSSWNWENSWSSSRQGHRNKWWK